MNNRTIALSLGTLAILFSFAGAAFGASGLGQSKYLGNQTVLNAAMVQVSCKTNFTTAFLSDVGTQIPSLTSTMGNFSSALKQDTSQLQTLANAGDTTPFKSYLTGTYDPELNTIAKSIIPDVKASNTSKAELANIRSSYNSLKASESNCSFSAWQGIGQDKITFDQDAIAAYQNETAKIAARGINVSSLTSILLSANSTSLQPLTSAINSAKNQSQLKTAINSYCLFDGCANGTNFHLAAKFDWQKLTLISQWASSNSIYDNTTILAEVNTDLGNASTTLGQVGSAAYTGTQSNTIWSNLKNAGTLLHDLLTNTNGKNVGVLPGGRLGTASVSAVSTPVVGGTPT